jgi:hypothetical protein
MSAQPNATSERSGADQRPSAADENSTVKANPADDPNVHEAAHSAQLELEQLTQLWQQAPTDAEALLRSVKARSASLRSWHYFEIGLTLLALGLLFNALRAPLNNAMWFFVIVSLPSVIWLQWLTSKIRLSARDVQAHDAQSLLALAIKQCQAEIRLADLTRKCCHFASLFGAVWLPWLVISSRPLQGHDLFLVPFAIIWWVGWLSLMYAWAIRKLQRETDRIKGLKSKLYLD